MVDADIRRIAVRTRDYFLRRIAEMAGIISHRPAVFACMHHGDSPYWKRIIQAVIIGDRAQTSCRSGLRAAPEAVTISGKAISGPDRGVKILPTK
jgi:hypothetical protein